MLVIEIAADVLFLSEAVSGALVSPSVVAVNVSLVGVRMVGAIPPPPTFMTWGLSAAESVIVIFPVREPIVVGVNVTEMEQAAPAARDDPQLFVCAKSGLDDVILAIDIVLEVLFLNETPTGGLVSPTAVDFSTVLDGVTVVGLTPLPLTLIT
jgi:hypothetical protein